MAALHSCTTRIRRRARPPSYTTLRGTTLQTSRWRGHAPSAPHTPVGTRHQHRGSGGLHIAPTHPGWCGLQVVGDLPDVTGSQLPAPREATTLRRNTPDGEGQPHHSGRPPGRITVGEGEVQPRCVVSAVSSPTHRRWQPFGALRLRCVPRGCRRCWLWLCTALVARCAVVVSGVSVALVARVVLFVSVVLVGLFGGGGGGGVSALFRQVAALG